MTRSWVAAAVFAAALLATVRPGIATELPTASGPVVVTITGKIANHNRGASDAFADAFFKYHEKSFDNALALDHSVLGELAQVEITADAEPWQGPVKLRGPLLADVLTLAGAEAGTVTLYALDGYGVALKPSDLDAQDWVLALEADGRPLSIGGRGPAWLAYEKPDGSKASADEEGKWIWSVFYITVD